MGLQGALSHGCSPIVQLPIVRLLSLLYSVQRTITEVAANARQLKQAASAEPSDLVYVEFEGGIWHLGRVQRHESDTKLAVFFHDNTQEIIDFEAEQVVSAMERGAISSGLAVRSNIGRAGADEAMSEPPCTAAKPHLGRPHPLVRLRLGANRGSCSRLDQLIKTEPTEPKEQNGNASVFSEVAVWRETIDLEFVPIQRVQEECSLCLEPLLHGVVKVEPVTGEREWVMRTECKHHFHQSCLQQWMGKCQPQEQSCPICRQNLPSGVRR